MGRTCFATWLVSSQAMAVGTQVVQESDVIQSAAGGIWDMHGTVSGYQLSTTVINYLSWISLKEGRVLLAQGCGGFIPGSCGFTGTVPVMGSTVWWSMWQDWPVHFRASRTQRERGREGRGPGSPMCSRDVTSWPNSHPIHKSDTAFQWNQRLETRLWHISPWRTLRIHATACGGWREGF